MKAGLSLMLGLLLAFVLAVVYWLRTPHPFGTPWQPLYHGLEQVDGLTGLLYHIDKR